MQKNLSQVFDQLINFPICYGTDDITKIYQEVSKRIDINDYLEYSDSIREGNGYSGIFRFVMNIMVSGNSEFIPFVTALNSDVQKEKKKESEIKADSLQKSNNIEYNFSDFINDVVQSSEEKVDIPRLSFTAEVNEENGNLKISDTRRFNHKEKGEIWYKSLDGDKQNEEVSFLNILKEKGKGNSFVDIVSNTYLSKTDHKRLYYTLINMDSSFDDSGRLTRIMIVSSNIDEAETFLTLNLDKIREIASFIRTRYVYDLLQKNRFESIKTAVSAIMTRNMSHNLGSHFLYYAKKHLERLADDISNEHSPDIRGAARVLAYIQARMDYLATIISNDKYPYGSVNFKSQIFDELTIDSFSKRHFPTAKRNNRTVNYLLSNLVRSEDFTRRDIMLDEDVVPNKVDLLNVQVRYSDDGELFQPFTGTNFVLDEGDSIEDYPDATTMESEVDIKRILSNIDIALPGGIMSCHAFFNVIENFIRNSAKYMREDFRHPTNSGEKSLTINIALNYDDPSHRFINIVLFDDKENAAYYKLLHRTIILDKKIHELNDTITSFITSDKPEIEQLRKVGPTIIQQIEKSQIVDKKSLLKEVKSIIKAWNKECLYDQIIHRLGDIRILDEGNILNKENKGLKEMIFSAAWMRAYCFPRQKTYTDIIFDIQEQTDGTSRLQMIRDYCFSPVLVRDNGERLEIIPSEELQKDDYFEPFNLGLSIKLPIFRRLAEVETSCDEHQLIENCLDTYADIVIAETNDYTPMDLKTIFTRFRNKNKCEDKSETEILRDILCERFVGFENYYLSFGGKCESCGIHTNEFQIKYDQHMKFHADLEQEQVYAYSDSVSGGDFTKTMNELFDASISDAGTYINDSDEYFFLKIKESALTRITIIDERLSDSMVTGDTQLELSLKNIRVLNYKDSEIITDFTDLFDGNIFKDGNNATDFLSIHLGLVEKIIQSSEYINYVGEMSLAERAIKFMEQLKAHFSGERRLFISIHSGRGNFSAELEGPLAGYPFITMSSLESAFNNSKFQLSQLLYNTLYIGKGKINSIYKNEKDSSLDC